MSNSRPLWSIPKIGKGPRTRFSHVPEETQGGHKPGKHGKPGKLREFEKLSKSHGKRREFEFFVGKTWKTQEMINL